jgi:hypothetical protein
MNILNLRNGVINDYHQYVESFLNIQDERIKQFVNEELSSGILWPDPLIQLNPSYEMEKTVSQLVKDGVLHPLCEKIFQKDGKSFHLYHHQEQAVRTALKKEHYVLTTGTGSGKSLTYLIPIIDHILKNNPEPEKTRALIVYPMNALINSQAKEIDRLLSNLGEGNSPIRFGRYTGQETQNEKDQLQQHPPHILLTNYVMLELMMSRPRESVFLDRTLSNLEFLVLDELHTYTGRQGADVSMLVRRLRQRCGNDNRLCIGTSATMVTGGTRDAQRYAVAHIAGKIFGITVSSENVIDERLKKSIQFSGDTPQLSLFDNEAPIVEVHKKWESAAEKERKSRTRFAQHAIKPDEVAQELKVSDAVLGNSQVVETFISTACQRLGGPIVRATRHLKLDILQLPQAVQLKVPDKKIEKIKFEQPVEDGITYISRNHLLTTALAEYLFGIALQPDGNRNIAARCGVIRSKDVEAITVLLLLRIRFLLKDKRLDIPSFAEECIVSGFQGTIGSEKWLSQEKAESLFEGVVPSENISDNDKKYWVDTVLKDFNKAKYKIDALAKERANTLLQSYERLRKTIKSGQVTVEPLLPMDVLTLSIIVPQPKI